MSNKANLKLALLANRAASHGKPGKIAAALLHQAGRVLFSCDIGVCARIDPSCEFNHLGLGCVIHEKAVVGKDCPVLPARDDRLRMVGGVLPVRACPGSETA